MNKETITTFFEQVDSSVLYNEASIQFELGWYLREKFPNARIQIERNVRHLNQSKKDFVKSEIDILFSEPDNHRHIVIELKAPIDQEQVRPVTVFNWIKDIRFLEQLSKKGIFGYSIFITDNFGYQECDRDTKRLLTNFRARNIQGTYNKHENTNKENETITLDKEYVFEWTKLKERFYYFITEIK